jgi:hypothetical protein
LGDPADALIGKAAKAGYDLEPIRGLLSGTNRMVQADLSNSRLKVSSP